MFCMTEGRLSVFAGSLYVMVWSQTHKTYTFLKGLDELLRSPRVQKIQGQTLTMNEPEARPKHRVTILQ